MKAPPHQPDVVSSHNQAGKSLRKALPSVGGLRLNAGYGGGKAFAERLFANVELQFGTPLDALPVAHPAFSLVAEWVRGDVNLALRARFRGFAAQAGRFDGGDFGGGLSYTHRLH